jgi:hypothetical protein
MRRRADIVSAWIALVVGVHLFPVGWLLDDSLVSVIAVLVTFVRLPPSRLPRGAPSP